MPALTRDLSGRHTRLPGTNAHRSTTWSCKACPASAAALRTIDDLLSRMLLISPPVRLAEAIFSRTLRRPPNRYVRPLKQGHKTRTRGVREIQLNIGPRVLNRIDPGHLVTAATSPGTRRGPISPAAPVARIFISVRHRRANQALPPGRQR